MVPLKPVFAAILLFAFSALSISADEVGWSVVGSQQKVEEGVGFQIYKTTTQDGEIGPMVFLLGGSEGGYFSGSAAELVSQGFSVTALAYFDFEGGPKNLSEIDVTSISNLIERISSGYGGPGECVGVLGVSKGAELALVIAANTDPAAAYVAISPSHVVWQASNLSMRRKSSWMLDGKALPFVQYPWFTLGMGRALWDVRGAGQLHKRALKNQRAVETASINVENIADPVLLQSGRLDELWPATAMSNAIVSRSDELAPGHSIAHSAFDVDHYVYNDPTARKEAFQFLKTALKDDCVAQLSIR